MNHYELLGISRDATELEIKKAYRKAALKWHPDKNPPEQKEACEDMFKKLSTAYAVLNDSKTKAEYDDYLKSEEQGQVDEEDFPEPSSYEKPKKWRDPNVDLRQAEEFYKAVDLFFKHLNEQQKQGVQLANYAKEGNWEEVKLLASNIGSLFLNQWDSDGKTALHYAVRQGSIGNATFLLDRGANVNTYTNRNLRPIYYAVYHNNYPMCQLLIERGAQLHFKDDKFKETPLHLAINENKDLIIQRLLIEKATRYGFLMGNSSLDVQEDNNNDTPLHLTIRKGNIEIGNLLMLYGCNINLQNIHGNTPLQLALIKKHFDFAIELFNRGAKVN